MPPADPAPTGQVCILVLGMHRSGTSAVTRALSLMGAALPRDVMGANLGNETGHWEPATLVELNDRMLGSVGRSWSDCRRIDRPIDADVESSLAYEIGWQYRGLSPFVLKDPRVCLLVPTYERALAALGAQPVHVLVLRNPIASSASLVKRDGVPAALAQCLWLRYLLEAEAATRGRPRVLVQYDAVIEDWRGALGPVAAMAGMNLPASQSLQSLEIEEFLSPARRHHESAPIDVGGELGEWLADADAAFNKLVADPSNAPARARLDDIHGALDAVTRVAGFDPAQFGQAIPAAAGSGRQ
jgi:hypothetical protein